MSPAETQQPVPDDPTANLPLLELRDGLSEVVDENAALTDAIEAFRSGTGPVAVDAERASGYRYSHRAYLVQLRREGAGSALVDPIPFGDLSALGDAIVDAEWIIHAANQDLPCLAEIGMVPRAVFDTELAGRLLGYPKVGLASLVSEVLGFRMRKEHSAADWSTRPLPAPWLVYAQLDVEMLIELRDAIEAELRREGKWDWAQQEFAAILAAPPREPKPDPWRRTSGMHRVRNRRSLAVVRALWEARDQIASSADISPGRILPDAAIVEAAAAMPVDRDTLQRLTAFKGRGAHRHMRTWWEAIDHARKLPESQLPKQGPRYDGPPPARAWADRDPDAAARLSAARAAVSEIAEAHRLPTENLLAPDTIRRLAWAPPADASVEVVTTFLRDHAAREWQIGLTVEVLTDALGKTAPAEPLT
ncbi:ribonuclease D [Kribbella amoyensis]|uniref:Ribonuclease D n=1 Tax=Kribbella amoyensis TaxID=996641 RepID=A0A561BYH4_9ACTN|nr:HRDC domain-containing protein [Kribbella amoyensis]TWD83861.1 ribonuclease D [Kribbella amoyensis]